MNKRIGEIIKSTREKKKISRLQLSKLSKVSMPTIKKIEEQEDTIDNIKVRINSISKLAKALNLDFDELIEGK